MNPTPWSLESSLMQPTTPSGAWPRLRAWLGPRPAVELHDEAIGVEAALPWTLDSSTFDDTHVPS